MPNRFYNIERPRKRHQLPKVISIEEAKALIEATNNIKHRCIASLLYSAGLRRGEIINLRLSDIDSKRMLIFIKDAKGNKERPKTYLFESPEGGQYSPQSIGKIIRRAGIKAKVRILVTPHILRHSFATHLMESGVDIRYIQTLLGHSSSKTTEIYTHVAINKIRVIKNLLD